MNLIELKNTAIEAIESEKESILALSRDINEHPETAYEEHHAVAALSDFLAKRGFKITPRAGGLDTAFTADFTSSQNSGFVPVALIAEYDALPGVGHGCGHNLIAAGAAAAAIGTSAAVTAAGGGSGKAGFRLIGTPAEEILTEPAGKNRLIKAGVFKNVGSALMFHPWWQTGVARHDLGLQAYKIVFTGRTAHAAADPWNGINALDAAVVFYNSISMLRQQLPSGMKIHCIIPEGGKVLNVIPDYAVVEVMIRSTKQEEIVDIKKRIDDCVVAAAAASGCTYEVLPMAAVKPINFNQDLFNLTAANMADAGETLEEIPLWQASSDFGDVSHEVPSLSLLYHTHEKMRWHSEDVALGAAGRPANEAMLRAAKILAATAIDILYGDSPF